MNDVFSRIDHSRTADEIVGQVEGLVLEGVLRVGDRLPGERELAAQLHVSRPILRDALKELERRGLIVTRHGAGAFVADIIGEVFSKPMTDLIASHPRAAYDYLEYRREIEAVAAGLAASRATAADKALLERIVVEMEAAFSQDDFAEEARLDVDFHNAVGECAHNVILLHTLRSCYRLLADGVFFNRSLIYSQPGARAQLLAQHRAIMQAISAGDPDAARKAAEAHMAFVEQAMREAERASSWERVARLRLAQRARSGRTAHGDGGRAVG